MMRMGAFILLAISLLTSGIMPALAQETTTHPATAPSTNQTTRRAVVIPLTGMIDDFNRDQLFKRFDEAKDRGADLVILDVNTYGGLVTSGLDISRFLKQQTELEVIAFVGEKAISAGVMIALACDTIYMAPSALMGDSAPIAMGPVGGPATLGDTERAKAESPILEDFYASAIQNGYDPLLTQAMVSIGRSVHWIENTETGSRRFVDAAEYDKLTAGEKSPWTPVPGVRNPIDGPDDLLTVHADLAVKLGLAQDTAASVEDVARKVNATIISTLTPSAGEYLVGWLNSATVRMFIIVILVASLFVSLHIPGHGVPEALAVIAFGTLIAVPLLTGYAQWWEVVAILLGIGLLAVELFVLPGFGVIGFAGIVLFLFGLLMTFVGTEPVEIPGWLPSLKGTWDALRRGLYSVAIAMAVSLFLWFWLSKYLPRLPYFNRLILSTTAGGTAAIADEPTATTEGPVVGDHAEAISDLRPSGQVRLTRDGRIVSVVSESGYLRSGAAVIVREISGNRVVVRSTEPPVASSSRGASGQERT